MSSVAIEANLAVPLERSFLKENGDEMGFAPAGRPTLN